MSQARLGDQVVGSDQIAPAAGADGARLLGGLETLACVGRLDPALDGLDAAQIDHRHDTIQFKVERVFMLAGANRCEAA